MSDNKVKSPLEEYLDDISDLIDERKFKDIYMIRHPFNQELTILLNEEGINLLEEIPEIKKHIRDMEDYLVPKQYDNYNGTQLYQLIDDFGAIEYCYIYLYYFKHNSKYKLEPIDDNYSHSNTHQDYYICEVDSWDIDKFKKEIDTFDDPDFL